jgi:hypothetical protein
VVKVRCSPVQWEEFKKTSIYLDIQDELGMWIDDIRNTLEDPDHNLNFELMRSLQGSVKALRRVQNSLIDVLVGLAEERKDS